MRACPDPGRRIVLRDIRKQKEHKQGASPRCEIDPPSRIVATGTMPVLAIVGLRSNAGVYVPPEVPGSSVEGNRTTNMPTLGRGLQCPTPTRFSKAS